VSAREQWPGEGPKEDADEEPYGDEDTGDDLEQDAEPLGDEAEPQLRLAGHAPGELDIPDDVDLLEGEPRGTRRGVGVVAARFNGDVTNRLLESALAELDQAGIPRSMVTVMVVPGAFELPLGAMYAARTGRYEGVVALGAVIRGETSHYDHVCAEAARGIQDVQLETAVPCGFGLLTVETMEQALARLGEKRHQGRDAARAALRMAALRHELFERT
jgi:6,7-dimethyl-8-ribityllumazine synthase